MPGKSDNNTSNPETVTIAEAARRLGVSERTIYRRLREGKIQRADVSDNRLTNVTISTMFSSQVTDNLSDNETVLSDKSYEEVLSVLKQEMAEKDRLIANLLDNQRELVQTVNQLQQQLHELAKWVLAQKSGSEAMAEALARAQTTETLRNQNWLSKLLFSRHSRARGDEKE
jgi:predicted DNA-binding transcriptional regulator YafY